MSGRPVMSVAEVAELIGISREYVRRLLPAHGIKPVRGYPTDQVLALHANRQEVVMDRKALLDEAREIARTVPEGVSIRAALADHVIDGIHTAFPHLRTLDNARTMSASRDQDRYLEQLPDGAEVDYLDGYSDSEETAMARCAYDAALRSLVLGYRVFS